MVATETSSSFGDQRLEKRFSSILEGFVESGSSSVHKTFKQYNDQKACYRFLDNDKVTEQKLIDRLGEKCSKQVKGKSVIAIVDTSRIALDSCLGRISNYEGIGILSKNQHTSSHGFLLHPIYVVDFETGCPYGLANVELINRSMTGNELTKKEKKHNIWKLPIDEKESYKWIGPLLSAQDQALKDASNITYVMDREADIWEVYERIGGEKVDVVVRSKENRLIKNLDGQRTKLYAEIEKQDALGYCKIELPRKKGRSKGKVKVSLKAGRCLMTRKRNKVNTAPLAMSYVEVKQVDEKTKECLHWILWTNKTITTAQQAKQIVDIYVKRWQIEVFFKLLKTDGYQLEKSQLESGPSIRKLSLLLMEASIKILQLKAARSGKTDLKVSDVFNDEEISCLKQINIKMQGRTAKQSNPYPPEHLSWACWIIARLGGWTEFYTSKSPPGNKTLKWGLDSFDSIMIGYRLRGK